VGNLAVWKTIDSGAASVLAVATTGYILLGIYLEERC